MVILKENERNEFSDETVEKAWEDAKKKCEKCGKKLKWENRGRDNDNYWEAHHKDGDAKNDKLENCQILCWPCHEETLKKGKTTESVIKIKLKDLLGEK